MKTTTLVSCLMGGLLAAACGSEAPPTEPPKAAGLEDDPVVIVTAEAVATAAATLTSTGAGGATSAATAGGAITMSGNAESGAPSSGASNSSAEASNSTQSGGSAGANPSGQAGTGGSPDVATEGPSSGSSGAGAVGQSVSTGEPLPPAPIPIGAVRITEYVEGSSNDKAIELSNLGTTVVSLVACRLELYFNDNLEPGPAIDLAVELGPEASHVLCHTRASAELLAVCDQTTAQLSFNGNDTLVLRCDEAVHDSFGQLGFDGTAWRNTAPSSEEPWTGAFSSVDHVLRHRCEGPPRTEPMQPFEPALTADWFPVWSFTAPPSRGAAYDGLGDPACTAPDPGAGGAPGLD